MRKIVMKSPASKKLVTWMLVEEDLETRRPDVEKIGSWSPAEGNLVFLRTEEQIL